MSPATRSKLLQILCNNQEVIKVKVELAVVVDVGEHFVKSTYALEGDGLLSLSCYEEIVKIRSAIHSAFYPNLQAVVRSLTQKVTLQSQLSTYGLNCVKPGIDYFNEHLGSDLKMPMKFFKAARFFSPLKINEIQPTATDLDCLDVFPCLTQSIDPLKHELPTYLAKAIDVSTESEIEIWKWWQIHSEELPNWSSAAHQVFLVQPSSSASERVFSILNNTFGNQQQNSLNDYVEASLMVQ